MTEFNTLRKAFNILGLTPMADPTDLEAAYENLTASWDPARFGDALPQIKSKALQRRAEIRWAYETVWPHIHSKEAAVYREKTRVFQQAARIARIRAQVSAKGLEAVGRAKQKEKTAKEQKRAEQLQAGREFAARAYQTGEQQRTTADSYEKRRRSEAGADRLAHKNAPKVVGSIFWSFTALVFIWLICLDAVYSGISIYTPMGLLASALVLAYTLRSAVLVIRRAPVTGPQKSAIRFYILFFTLFFLASRHLVPHGIHGQKHPEDPGGASHALLSVS